MAASKSSALCQHDLCDLAYGYCDLWHDVCIYARLLFCMYDTYKTQRLTLDRMIMMNE